MSQPLSQSLTRDLRRIVGGGALITEPGRLLAYESDGLTAYRMPPAAVVLPEDTAEASRVVAALHGAGIAVVPRGAGTGLSGGALAVDGGVVVGTARMTRLLDMDVEGRRARVQAGMLNARLSDAARPHGLFYAPDPSSQSACTLGGNVAENSGGPHCLKYGVTSRYVTGLTLVLAGGEVAELGGTAGHSGGLDLVGTVVGSEGCFGLATEVEVRLLPLPEGVRTLLAVFDEIEDAGRAVTDIIGRGLLPAALEIVDRETIRAVESSVYAAGYPVGAGAALVVEFDGTEAGLDEDVAAAVACCRAAGARDVRRARDERERAALWKGRKKAFGAMGRVAPDLLVQDATVPRTRLPEVLGRIGEIARRHGLTVANVFHAGDGNLHPNILFDRRDTAELEKVGRASREIMSVCVEAGGTITGEHGVGIDKRGYMRLVHGPEELAAMAAVKEAFDPRGGFNPGKVLPDDLPAVATAEPGSPGREVGGSGPGDPRRSDGGSGEAGHGPRAGRTPRGPDAVAARLEGLLEPALVARAGDFDAPLVSPRSTEEVAIVLREASALGWRVAPVGRGLWPMVGRRRASVDVVLATSGLEGVLEYEPADLTLTARAGLGLDELAELTAARGQWLPLEPPGEPSATLGGVLATGFGGALAACYGKPRDLVLGLTCVTGDGRVLRLGGRVVKNVAGFDLVKLLVGSRGELGVITDATVRLFPLPAEDRVLVARAERLEDLVPLLRTVSGAPLVPAALGAGEPDEAGVGAVAVVRLVGGAAAVEAQEEAVRTRAPDLAPAEPEEGRRVLQALRGSDAWAPLAVRMTYPPGSLAKAVSLVRSLGGGTGTGGGGERVAVHADRGIVRWAAVRSVPAAPDACLDILEGVGRQLATLGGSAVATAVPLEWPREPLMSPAEPVLARLERRLRARFDPAGVLTPEPRVGSGSSPASPTGAPSP